MNVHNFFKQLTFPSWYYSNAIQLQQVFLSSISAEATENTDIRIYL